MDAKRRITLKRIAGELRQLEKNREPYYQVIQDTKEPLHFYFLICGDPTTVYKGGKYIGKIILPNDYPGSAGDFYVLTPSGRFSVNKKICLTNSGYHSESWTPLWNINNMVIAFTSIFVSDDTTGISHIKETPQERQRKALNSVEYNFLHHENIFKMFTQFVKPDNTIRTEAEVNEFIQEHKKKKKLVKSATSKEE